MFVVSTLAVNATTQGCGATSIMMLLSLFLVPLTVLVVASDPGIVLPSAKQLSDLEETPDLDYEICDQCQAIQEDINTLHCETCDVCIQGLDHHCPWTSKCVGQKNKHVFWVWIGSVLVYLVVGGCLCGG
eukprot:Gregarina_sp_Poly_1__1722@NODE_1444_length_4133_cov_160_835957_g144_i1_p6_GENE_NODE_1444_length_4133_cov_160_835957_g144_i1NODE_1444_length_4133_cov_160_835957_g144_i1_p6_ORF_typecomplete_len130_score9_48DHHC/PF01529_20/9_2e02DHHC/PF01529_20/8_6e17stn_TNFRSF12A/PF12191_8/1_1_NODE_1444_length_4133_cov_160_835957_g144_i136023991